MSHPDANPNPDSMLVNRLDSVLMSAEDCRRAKECMRQAEGIADLVVGAWQGIQSLAAFARGGAKHGRRETRTGWFVSR